MAPYHTGFGSSIQPPSVGDLIYRADMKIDSKNVLWANLSALMMARYGKENLTRLAKESGVGPGTMTRIKERETSVGVDVLEKLATVMRVEAWQLLHPTMGTPGPTLVHTAPTDRQAVHTLAQTMTALPATTRAEIADRFKVLTQAPDSAIVAQGLIDALATSEPELKQATG